MKNLVLRYIVFSIATVFVCVQVAIAQVNDPVPAPIEFGTISVELEDVATIPSSSTSRPLARINILKTSKDNSNRHFLNDLRGKLYVINGGVPSVYLDLDAQRPDFVDSPGLGTGFGMFEFHPEFQNNGIFYTTHAEQANSGTPDFTPPITVSISLQWVLTEWTATDPTANVFSGSSREMMRVDFPGTIHGMQDMSFNPTAVSGESDYGMLYLCLGDAGVTLGGSPGNTQKFNSILGNIVRIDPLGNNSGNGQYGIPVDNPYATAQGDTIREIWTRGFRNPHRISWDTGGDNKMLIGDIGERNLEEINLGAPGLNYGWNKREGTFLFEYQTRDFVYPLPANDSTFNYTYPVAQYDHDEGFGIVGGFVYRGTNVPALIGKYVFGDIVRGRIFYVEVDSLVQGRQAEDIKELRLFQNGNEVTLLQLVGNTRADLRFGVDDQQEMYVLTKQDAVVRMMKPSSATGIGGLDNAVPQEFALLQNYPNPFNPTTSIPFVLKRTASVELQVFNAAGQLVDQKSTSVLPIGEHTLEWGSGDLSSGVYLYRVTANGQSQMRKMLLLK
ncbi:MAG: PQQ-dependent sugar dehydrogenase [Calditrichia bacterium]